MHNKVLTRGPNKTALVPLYISYVSSVNTHMGQKVFDMNTFSIIVYHRRYHVIPMNRDKDVY